MFAYHKRIYSKYLRYLFDYRPETVCHKLNIYTSELHLQNHIFEQIPYCSKSSFFIHNLCFASKVVILGFIEVFTIIFVH